MLSSSRASSKLSSPCPDHHNPQSSGEKTEMWQEIPAGDMGTRNQSMLLEKLC